MNAPLKALSVSSEHPFPGLRPFAYPDHEYFFGREAQTYALYRLIDRSRFIAVVGSSGSGMAPFSACSAGAAAKIISFANIECHIIRVRI